MSRLLTVSSAILLAGAIGWAGYWLSLAHRAEAHIAASIAYLNDRNAAAGSRTRIEYDKLEATHFLGWPHIVATPIRLHQESDMRSYRIELEEMRFLPETADFQRIELRVPVTFIAAETFGSRRSDYRVTVTPMPRLWLRTPASQRGDGQDTSPLAGWQRQAPPPADWPPDRLHQFAYLSPQKLELSVERDGAGNTAAFDLPVMPVRLWQPLPLRPERPLDLFFSLLAEIAETRSR